MTVDVADHPRQTPGQRYATRADADERQLVDAAIPFENLVRDPRERPPDAVGIHHNGHGGTRTLRDDEMGW